MKNQFKSILLLAAIAIILSSCNINGVPANTEGVLKENYGRKGKPDFKIVTGAQGILFWGSDLYLVPQNPETGDPQFIKILSKNSGSFTVDPTYTYNALPGRGVDIVFFFGYLGVDKSFYEKIERSVLNNKVTNAYREEARKFSTDSILNNLQKFEITVENRLKREFLIYGFNLGDLTSGLTPPPSTIKAIEDRNNVKIKAETVKDQIEVAKRLQDVAAIDAQTNRIKTAGLSRELLQEKFIDALRETKNKVIVTNGNTPVLIN